MLHVNEYPHKTPLPSLSAAERSIHNAERSASLRAQQRGLRSMIDDRSSCGLPGAM